MAQPTLAPRQRCIGAMTNLVQPVRLGKAGQAGDYQVNFAFTGPVLQFVGRDGNQHIAA